MWLLGNWILVNPSRKDFFKNDVRWSFQRVETDQLWHSMESLFAAALWEPQTIPKIKTHINYNSNTVKNGLYEELDISWPTQILNCVGLQCSRVDYSSTIRWKTALVEMESSREPNFIRTWSTDSWPDRRDWRLSILKSEDGIDKVCNVRDLVQAIGEGLEFVGNPNGNQLNFRSDFRLD